MRTGLSAGTGFEHPQQFRTKGQVHIEAIKSDIANGFEQTRSCVRGSRDRLGGRHCGVCSGCLLRRTTFHAAGIENGPYFWGRSVRYSVISAEPRVSKSIGCSARFAWLAERLFVSHHHLHAERERVKTCVAIPRTWDSGQPGLRLAQYANGYRSQVFRPNIFPQSSRDIIPVRRISCRRSRRIRRTPRARRPLSPRPRCLSIWRIRAPCVCSTGFLCFAG